MKTYAPDYYLNFKCIANECKNNCCIGWEIDIDRSTYLKYIKLQLTENIAFNNNCEPYFSLGNNKRCPYLNDNNLCEIIINFGKEYLCQICSDHPRFRNDLTSRTEIGIGLCCEAAAELILNNENITQIVEIGNDKTSGTDDELFLEQRDDIFKIIQNRSVSFEKRILELYNKYDIQKKSYTPQQWSTILLSLEQLDANWTNLLTEIKNKTKPIEKNRHNINDIQLEQLLHYFIFRHLSPTMFTKTLSFSLKCIDIIQSIMANISDNNKFIDICRMFSAEVEYSQENTDFLMDI